MEASFFRFLQMPCVFKARNNPQFNRAAQLKGVAGFKKQSDLYPYKHWSKSQTYSTFSFNCLSNLDLKVLTICLGLRCLLEQQ